ncbi:MAG: hypothetical protein ACTSWT_05160 [Candidatus Heimdallarchaeota archaeon]
MNSTKLRHLSVIFVVTIAAVILVGVPFLTVRAETVQMAYYDFYIQPSRPEVIAESSFVLSAENQYVEGIPEDYAIGHRSDSGTYYLEVWSDARVEVYILDSSGFFSQYAEYISEFVGNNPPDPYTFFFICDGYLKVEFSTTISPKLIFFSEGVHVSGNYLLTEGTGEIIYQPYHMQIVGGDRTTFDTVHIFNLNASVNVYILDDDQYTSYKLTPQTPPSSLNSIAYETGITETKLNYTAEAGVTYHLIIWHYEFHDGVSGTLIYTYTYKPGFFESYWSLLLLVVLAIGLTLFLVFHKKTLPPVVWTFSKARFYVLKKPWEAFKKYLGEIKSNYIDISESVRGISDLEQYRKEKEIISPHNQWLVASLSLIFPLSLHHFIVKKFTNGIYSILLNVLAILLFLGAATEFSNQIIGLGIIFLLLGVVLIVPYILDIVAAFVGVFKDNKGRVINRKLSKIDEEKEEQEKTKESKQ